MRVRAMVLAVLPLLAGAGLWWLLRESGGSGRSSRAVSGAPQFVERSRPADDRTLAVVPLTATPVVDLDKADRERDLHGVVVNRAGDPVVAARIAATSRTEGEWPARAGDPADIAETRSAVDGSFLLRLAARQVVNLEVTADGYAARRCEGYGAGERVRIVMARCAELSIRVESEGGAPIPGAYVVCVASTPPVHTWSDRGYTDSDGVRVVRACPASTPLGIVVAHEAFVPMHLETSLEEGSRSIIQVTLGAAGRVVTGRVCDAETGHPVVAADVTALPGPAAVSVKTDADGRFAWNCWHDSSTDAGSVSSDGPSVKRSRIAVPKRLEVRANGYEHSVKFVGDASHLEFRMKRTSWIRGRVIDEAGKPLAGGVVRLQAYRSSRESPLLQGVRTAEGLAETDQGGAFDIDGVSSGAWATLVCDAPGFCRTAVDCELEPDSDTLDLGDIAMEKGFTLDGTLEGPGGTPAARVRVFLVENGRRDRMKPGARPADPGFGSRRSRWSDDLGRIRFDNVPNGHHRIEVYVPQGPVMVCRVTVSGAGRSLRILLREGRPGTIVRVDTGERIEGHVVAVQGYQLEVSVGDADGVAVGDVMRVMRSGVEVAKISITGIQPRRAAGQILGGPGNGETPRAGDSVVSAAE